ncbi:unnamed protein product [Darwinula stevensoni]|uniref:Peptidase S1 domain-containing protein n=1 Tax=Darwinula stevensoni TaxID=69355 RepID=A0A7R9A8U6_9CRUS|nr:unnamed protein product [Darwinula stevensoni]CAG0896821.1 unnamed protein product [Darwinula stevensoni]
MRSPASPREPSRVIPPDKCLHHEYGENGCSAAHSATRSSPPRQRKPRREPGSGNVASYVSQPPVVMHRLLLLVLQLLWPGCLAGNSLTATGANCLVVPPSVKLSGGAQCGSNTQSNWFETAHARIADGQSATIQDAPFMAFVQVTFAKRTASCGGAIIDGKHILTAAHCYYDSQDNNSPATSVTVRAGSAKQSQATAVVDVDKFNPHPGYKPGARTNDVAVILLKSSLTFTPTLQPICLPRPRNNNSDVIPVRACGPVVYGWGSASGASDDLQKTNATISRPPGACRANGETNIFCASAARGSVCSGDAGGPIVVRYGGTAFAMGVVGVVQGCTAAAFPFARVGTYAGWIKKVVGG